MLGSTWGAKSTTVTWMPMPWRFSASSRPMKPPPTTTAFFTPLSLAQARVATASSGVRMVNTPSSAVPSTGGTTGEAPVAMTSLS